MRRAPSSRGRDDALRNSVFDAAHQIGLSDPNALRWLEQNSHIVEEEEEEEEPQREVSQRFVCRYLCVLNLSSWGSPLTQRWLAICLEFLLILSFPQTRPPSDTHPPSLVFSSSSSEHDSSIASPSNDVSLTPMPFHQHSLVRFWAPRPARRSDHRAHTVFIHSYIPTHIVLSLEHVC